MALRLGELSIVLKIDKDGVHSGLAEAKAETRTAGREMERETSTTGRRMGDALGKGGSAGVQRFFRDANGRLRDERGRFVAGAGQLGAAAGQAASRGLSSLADGFANAAQQAGNAASNVWGWIPMLSALAAGAIFAIPAIYALAGALASLPALAAGLGAGIGVLGLGFMGLSDHFQKAARSGGSAGRQIVDTAYQIAQAERRVRDANREVLASTKALSDARETAAKRIRDLNSSLAQAHLDERAAVDAVADAEADLRAARTPEEIERRQLALDQANQTLADTRTRVEDLTEEQKENTREGVKGSDEVQSALERQRKAVEGLADAQHALREAEKPPPGGGGGGGGAVRQLTKLAPAAAALVATLKALKPAWESLRLDVQQRLFAGVSGEIRKLADAWLPQLHRSLGGMATTFNGLFKIFSRSAQDPEFIRNIGTAIESVRRQIDKVGGALAGPFVKAFGQLAAAAGPFLDVLGDKLAGAVTKFSEWIDKADQSGALNDFFQTAAKYLGEIWDLLTDLGGLAGDFFDMWDFSSNGEAAKGLFETIRGGLHDLREWLADPENKDMLQASIDGFVFLLTAGMKVMGWFITTFIPAMWRVQESTGNAIDKIASKAGHAKDWVVSKWNGLVGFFRGLPRRISGAARGMFDGIKNAFRSAINWMIGKWNGLQFTIGGGSFMGASIPSASFGTPDIPYLAKGGIVPARPGGRLIVAGDGGEDEPIMPLSKLAGMLRGIGGRTVLEIRSGGSRLDDLLVEVLREAIQDKGGGNVQAVLGRG